MPVGSGNVVQLIVPQTQPIERRDHVQGADKEAEFLSLRLLNKRARVRLSARGLDYSRLPGNASLFAAGNIKGWFAAVICGDDHRQYILMSTLADLRSAFESEQADPEPFIPFHANHTKLHVPSTPAFLKFALNDDCLIIGYLEGPVLVYSSQDVLRSNPNSQPSPIFTLSGDASTPRQIFPNPGDSPELVAVVRWLQDQNPGHQIDIIDVQNLKHVATWRGGYDPKVLPVTISWSPKGKQIAIGLQSGDMLLYSPQSPESPKSHLFKVPSTPADVTCLLSVNWLSNSTFHTVYSSPDASSPLFNPSISDPPNLSHFVSSQDSKARFAVDVELRDPCPPFGARRPPGLLSVVLRNWNPAKFLVFCGGGSSSDIGVIGSLRSDNASRPDGQWVNINLEETSTPSLPLDEELNELALLGLSVDLTSSKPIRMSEQSDDGTPDLPPSPILYAYANDGTLIAWHIINTNGEAYPGMSIGGNMDSIPAAQGSIQHKDSTKSVDMTTLPRIREQSPSTLNQTPSPPSKPSNLGFGAYANASTSANFVSGIGFGGAPATPVLRQRDAVPAFGSGEVSATGGSKVGQTTSQQRAPTFGTTGFGNATTVPTFGTSSFGSRPTAPVFGQSGFGSTTPGVQKSNTFMSTGGGFASFATQGTSTFGAPVDTTPASQPTSAFGSGGVGNASNVTRGAFAQQTSQSFSTFGGFGQATSSFGISTSGLAGSEPKQTRAEATSVPGSPPSPTASLPDSPELRPTALPSKPTSSYLKPAAGFGSFNKPSQGFGTFSGTGISSTTLPSKSAESSAFSLQKTPGSITEQPKTMTASAAPVFGATSALGQPKPVFGTSSFGSMPQPAANASKPITGGFSAFSSGGGGFASFATAGKTTSFADMLRSDDADKPKRDSKPLAFRSSSSTTEKAQPSGTPSPRDISSAPEETPIKTYSTRAGDEVDESDEEEDEGKERFSEEKLTGQEPSGAGAEERDSSLSLLSLGEITSEVSELLKDTSQEKDATDAKLFEKEDETTSEPLLLTDERLEVFAVDEAERHSGSGPRPEEGESPQDPPIPTDNHPRIVDKESTTPTGSPNKSVTTVPQKSSVTSEALSPVTPSITTLPQGVGLGRPSSRPLRSSPLASTPIMNAGNDSSKPDVIPAKSVSQTEEIPQHPMQTEFLRLHDEVTEGLVQLYTAIQETIVIRPIISEPRGLEKFLVDNQKFVPGQYSHGDLKAFTKMIGILHESVVPLLKLGVSKRLALRYLENLALITETKQEEVELWVHAHQDPSFADTLKPRTLSPEHSEHQFRLRKSIQSARDRVQQCEDMMEFLKRRLEHHRSGKIGLRPPSLDIIDRTCQNIQTALEQRVKLLEQLHDRIEKLSPKDSRRMQASQTRASSPMPTPAPVTPPFASIAAAALNSERSSLKLKTTLLSARKEPLLTTNVSKMQHPTGVEQNQPQFHERNLASYVTPLDSPQMTSPINRRSGRPGKRHGAVQLKEGLSETSPKSVVFDWGPLPGVTPMSELSSDVRNSRGT